MTIRFKMAIWTWSCVGKGRSRQFICVTPVLDPSAAGQWQRNNVIDHTSHRLTPVLDPSAAGQK